MPILHSPKQPALSNSQSKRRLDQGPTKLLNYTKCWVCNPTYILLKVTDSLDEITWFIYCGEYSSDDDFFRPLHISHLESLLPMVLPYIALMEGFGFVIDNEGYEDMVSCPTGIATMELSKP